MAKASSSRGNKVTLNDLKNVRNVKASFHAAAESMGIAETASLHANPSRTTHALNAVRTHLQNAKPNLIQLQRLTPEARAVCLRVDTMLRNLSEAIREVAVPNDSTHHVHYLSMARKDFDAAYSLVYTLQMNIQAAAL